MPITTPSDRLADYDNDPDHFLHVQEHLFVPAIEKAGFEAVPPAAQGSDFIHAGIISNLEQSDLVLCDMSTLNANVFFELGIRTALNLSTCMVRDGLPGRVPFDVGIINYHTYNPSLQPWIVKDELPKLVTHIEQTIARGPNNSLWRHLGLTQKASPPIEENPIEAKLDLALQRLADLSRTTPVNNLADLSRTTPVNNYASEPMMYAKTLHGHFEDAVGSGTISLVIPLRDGSMAVAFRKRPTPTQWQTVKRIAESAGVEVSMRVLQPGDE
jgi:hypothetical protein